MKTNKSNSVVSKKSKNTDEQKLEKIPAIKQQYLQLIDLREKSEKLIQIGEKHFLITKDELYECTETIVSKKFIRGEFKNGLANHLVYSGAFVVHKKLLQIEIGFQMKSGLLGDYLDVKGSYDGSSIGEFHALRSYAGGGANGTWPTLDGESWAVRFILKKPSHMEPEGCFSIHYFKLIQTFELTEAEHKGPGKVPQGSVGDFLSQNRFMLNEIQDHRNIIWKIPVNEEKAEIPSGELSMCTYPGFQEYRKINRTGFLSNQQSFISYAISDYNLVKLEFRYGAEIDQVSLRAPIEIQSKDEDDNRLY